MLYQLSYASALKPTKNSREGTQIASAAPEISSTPLASSVEKDRLVPSPATAICMIRNGLANTRPEGCE
jgi:hypothetical protein